MKQGVLIYDTESERMDVRFGLEEYYGGLHCGTCMDVFVGNRWKPTRIEYDWGDKGWYLVGIPTSSISGLRVRMAYKSWRISFREMRRTTQYRLHRAFIRPCSGAG